MKIGIRQSFINKENSKYLNFYDIQKQLQDEKQIEYISLPAKVSQQVLMKLDKNWKSFFVTIKDFKNNPSKYLGKPKLPKNQFNSNKLTKLTNKMNNKIDNYLHKTSKFIIDYCLANTKFTNKSCKSQMQ